MLAGEITVYVGNKVPLYMFIKQINPENWTRNWAKSFYQETVFCRNCEQNRGAFTVLGSGQGWGF